MKSMNLRMYLCLTPFLTIYHIIYFISNFNFSRQICFVTQTSQYIRTTMNKHKIKKLEFKTLVAALQNAWALLRWFLIISREFETEQSVTFDRWLWNMIIARWRSERVGPGAGVPIGQLKSGLKSTCVTIIGKTQTNLQTLQDWRSVFFQFLIWGNLIP